MRNTKPADMAGFVVFADLLVHHLAVPMTDEHLGPAPRVASILSGLCVQTSSHQRDECIQLKGLAEIGHGADPLRLGRRPVIGGDENDRWELAMVCSEFIGNRGAIQAGQVQVEQDQ